jgi:uncharacterized protein YdhG (YjbR/CyaY superfamily)
MIPCALEARMEAGKAGFQSIDQYIAAFPPEVQALLTQVRETIRSAIPEAAEKISYQMPAYYLHGNVVYFAGFRDRISVYPAPRGVPAFEPELSNYKGGKGTIQFPLDKPIPYELIARIARYRAEENLAKAAAKRS